MKTTSMPMIVSKPGLAHIVDRVVEMAKFLLHCGVYSGHDDYQSIVFPVKQHRTAMNA